MRRPQTTPDTEIDLWLAAEIAAAQPGDRLPTVREIMARFSVGQRRVEMALATFVQAGKVSSRRGAGLRVASPKDAPDASSYEADILILYRLSDSRLARNLMQEIEVRLRLRGITMLHVGYATDDKAISLLDRMQRFKVCLLQLHFETLSLRFLSALRAHCDHLVIDGVSVTGIEADGLGTNWREALTIAFFDLVQSGHQRIGFLTSSHPARQIAMARREYDLLCQALAPASRGLLMQIDKLPGEYLRDDIAKALSQGLSAGGQPMDALVAWGVVEGYLLESALAEVGLQPGRDLSVILLGSTDFPSEHRNIFDVAGNENEAKLNLFDRVITDRLYGGTLPVQTHYLPISLVRHGSIRPPEAKV